MISNQNINKLSPWLLSDQVIDIETDCNHVDQKLRIIVVIYTTHVFHEKERVVSALNNICNKLSTKLVSYK